MLRRTVTALFVFCALGLGDDLASRIESGLAPRYRINDDAGWRISERMEEHRTPGVSIAVIRAGKIVFAKGYGMAETGGRAVDTETLFQAASISKPVAAMAALHFVREGRLSLDEDVNAKLKTWKVPENSFTAKEKVTLRRLLSHSAGLTVHGFPGYRRSVSLPTVPQILDGASPANTAAIRVDVEPGSRWRYSGGGYTVMQQLLIDHLGKPYPQILRDTVLKPLGMTRSTYEQPLPSEFQANAARAHNGEGRKIEGDWHTYPEMAAAGLWTTPSDLARFGTEVWKASRGESNRVINAWIAKEMLTRQKGDYGLGVGFSKEGNVEWFGHGGSNAGFRCNWVMFADTGNGAVIMTNGDRGSALAGEVLRSIALAENWPAMQPTRKTVAKVEPAVLAEYAGTYRLRGADIPFRVSDGRLVATLPGGRRAEFYPESATKFFSPDAPEAVFHRVEGGIEIEIGGERVKKQP
jgi:CubicO group peptidase (beta-lactamase class C family)